MCHHAEIHSIQATFLRKSDPSEIFCSLHMSTDAVCPIHATYYPPALDLNQHFPVRVILEKGL